MFTAEGHVSLLQKELGIEMVTSALSMIENVVGLRDTDVRGLSSPNLVTTRTANRKNVLNCLYWMLLENLPPKCILY